MRRVIKLKLNMPISQILPTLEAYTASFNRCCKLGFDTHTFNNIELHKKTYKQESQFLPSQLTISARMKAYEALCSIKKRLYKNKLTSCPQSKQTSIRYDCRSYSVSFDKNFVSLLTVSGRIKVPIQVPEYFRKFLTWRRKSAELFIRKNKVFFNVVFEKDTEVFEKSNEVTGIDRGINNIAVCSNNKFYTGKHVKKICNKIQTLHSALQACGSKSAKRHLRKLSKKENRFKTDVNHQISKKIVQSLPEGSTIVLESLVNIREKRKQNKGRKFNKMIHSWSFFQLEQFLTYKAEEKGITIDFIDPRYTSQRCSRCGHIEKQNRKGNNFKCLSCGFTLNADLNASRNIQQLYLEAISLQSGLTVSQPIVSNLEPNSSNSGTSSNLWVGEADY